MSNSRPVQTDDYDQRKILRSMSSLGPPAKRPWFIYVVTLLSAIGGFLFGYDTGVVSGAMILLRNDFKLNFMWQQIIVSATVAAAWAFALIAGVLADSFGRKPIILLASFIFTTGAVLMGAAANTSILLGGRLVVGAGIGLASMTVPVYIAEVSPTEIRGTLVTLNNLCITAGQFVASIVDGAFSTTPQGWRYMLGLAGIPAFIQFFGFLLMPESPRWLISRFRYQDAIAVLRRIRGQTANTEDEFEAIKTSCIETERDRREMASTGPIILQVVRHAPLRRALIVGCSLQLFQQIAGINTVMYYTATIIEMSGVKDQSKAIWLSAATAGVNFVVCLLGVFVVEKIGRRKLTLASLAGVIFSLCVLAAGFQIVAYQSPHISDKDPFSLNTTCATYSMCSECVNDQKCGFCFTDDESFGYNGSCTVVDTKDANEPIGGLCSNMTEQPDSLTFAYEWCPTNYSWIILVGLLLYLTTFSPGMGSMPWTINAEIYPLWARSTCFSVSTSFNWFFNLLVSMTFLNLTEALTKYGTFWLYAVLALLGWVVFYFLLPETKGRTLEEMEDLFSHSWWQDKTMTNDKKIVQYVHIRGINRSSALDDPDSGDES